jgi:hypothetical protein
MMRTMRCSLAVLLALVACRRDAEREPTASPEPSAPPPTARVEPPPPKDVTPPPRPRERGTIFDDELARVTGHGPAWLLRQLAPEAYRRNGRFAGWQITACFPDDPELAAAADLEIGDIILTVEGDTLATPNAYSAMFEKAAKLDALHVARIRDGRREELVYRIAKAPLPEGDAAR